MQTYANLRTVQHVEAYCLDVCLHCRLSKYQYDTNKTIFVGMKSVLCVLYMQLFAAHSVAKLVSHFHC